MDRKFTPTALLLWGGLLLWAADFMFLYVFAALACARGFADAEVLGFKIIPFVGLLATALAAGAALLIMLRARREMRARRQDEHAQFIWFVTLAVGGLSLVAILLTLAPTLLPYPVCTPQPFGV